MADILYSKLDHASYSNSHAISCVKLALDWNIDFDANQITGSATHSVKIIEDGVAIALFDSKDLTITSVAVVADGPRSPVQWTAEPAHKAFGSKLSISIPESLRAKDSVFDIMFEYATSKDASAVQWLAPSATAGGQHPYVFTQCQAIHARSLLPCMDTPAVKVPYSATVRCPAWCTVLMSAVQDKEQSTSGVFQYNQPVAMPAYLIALAAGQLASAEISPRVRVWSEPSVVTQAAYEFSQTEDFLAAAEGLAGPYHWGRYDILCLPPSFPYGGMENPCLTFATPTLLAGDRSLADVIAHEIAHSWTGNLVTNATWSHFWLNEGWTVWLERKIMSRVNGEEYLKLSAEVGSESLVSSVKQMMADANDAQGFTQLVVPYVDQDPDDAFSSVPYEKGFAFLMYLESIVGLTSFEAFFKSYIQRFAFGTITSGDFRDYFVQYFAPWSSDIVDKIAAIDWSLWFTGRGMPVLQQDYSNSLSREAHEIAAAWIAAWKNDLSEPGSDRDSSVLRWSSKQTCIFLDDLLAAVNSSSCPLPAEGLKAMENRYHYTAAKNSEIKHRWLMLCLRGEAAWIVDAAIAFATSQGRMKFVRPLYRAMRLSSVAAEAAVETFNRQQHSYHPIARKMIAADLASIQALADAQE
jgi:leukotriene-A4 hydrolase